MAEVNKWMIDSNDAVMLLIDHQSGLFQLVRDIDLPILRHHVCALAKVAHLARIPTFTTASVPDGPNGPLIPEIHHLHPVLDLFFGKYVTATAKWAFFWRESLDDGIYRLSVVPLRTGQQSRKRYVGNSPSVTVVWTPTRHTTVQASYVHFFAGPFLEETPPGKDIDYVTVWFTYKF